jgi:signal transduction histidine kinase/ligand-binding sensor domain-containing protein/DNA-binding response OmpR family regulator
MTKKNIFINFIFCLFFAASLNAQNFERISNNEGFNQNTINSIQQDKYGFLWYATPNGLIRFDGYDFETFTTQSKSNGTISSNNITSLFNDANGLLWIGTNVGLNLYVPGLERFFTIDLKEGFEIKNIAQDKEGYIWFSGDKSLQRIKIIDIKTEQFEISNNVLNFNTNSNNFWLNTFCIGTNSSIILGTNEGLKKLDYQEKNQSLKTEITLFKDVKYFYDKIITSILKVDNVYWIGTNKGLYSSNLKIDDTFILNKVNVKDSNFNVYVNCIYKDNDKNLWIGTRASGLIKYNSSLNIFNNYEYDAKNKNSISSHRINAIYQDEYSVLWFGTAQGGINKLDVSQKPFYTYSNNPFDNLSLPDNLITSILEDRKGKVWIASYNKKLSRSINSINDISASKLKFENIEKEIPILKSDVIRSIFEDTKGFIWIGSDESVFVYNPQKNTFKKVKFKNFDDESFGFVRIIEQINDSEILFAGNKVVIVENPWQSIDDKKSFVHVKSVLNITEGNIQAFVKDNNNQFWLGTNKGLYQSFYNGQKIEIKNKFTESTKGIKITNNNVFSIHKKNNKLWIGTFGGGLNEVNLDSIGNPTSINYFRKNDILPDDAIYGILSGIKENLWISTDMGLLRLNTKDFTTSLFDVRDGLPQNNFRQKAYYKGKSGYLYFGGLHGLTIFNPASILINKQPPNILITSLLINNKLLKRGAVLNDKIILNKSISEADSIEICESQRIITFNVVAEHTSSPSKNKLAYKLEGFNKDWVITKSGKASITYTNLSPKKYQLKIKAANRDGVWSSKIKTLHISIKPLWYNTWWSYSILVLLLISFIVSVMYYFVRHEKLKQKLIYEQIDKDRMEVVNQGKFKYFTNLSHEFRTPLTLISAPLDRIIEGNIDPNNRKLLDIIKRNTHRLLSLVDQLITFRQAEQGYVKLNYTKLTLGEFLHPTTEAFENYSAEKSINFFYKIKSPNTEIIIDVEKFERILFNLLSNSFKNTPDQGSISIVANVKNKNDKKIIKIDIIDTGKGIPKENLENIFERFFQLGNEKGLVSVGGIGLAFCKSIVDLFNGKIKVKSEVNIGTKFTVYIPSKEINEIDEKEIQNKKSFIKNWVPLKVGEENAQKQKEQSNSKKHSLLIVENEIDIQNFLETTLSEKYNITIANNGVEALEQIKRKEFNTVISDIMMPEMDGFELCKRIKSAPETCNLPVLLLTALENETDLIKGLEFGADEYISKPFSLKHLELRIQKLIENNIRVKEYFSKNSLPPKEKKDLGLSKKDILFLEKLATIVENNLSNSNFGVEELSKEIGLSSSQFFRKLKQLTAQVPNVYIRNYRLQRAAELFDSNSGFNVAEVMYQIGIESNSYFSTSFKKLHGLSPSEYLKR